MRGVATCAHASKASWPRKQAGLANQWLARLGLAAVFQIFSKRPGNEARLPSDFFEESWFCRVVFNIT